MIGNAPNQLHSRPGPRTGRNPYVTYHDYDGPAKLTTTLVHAIANATGLDTTDADFYVSNHVDHEALDALFAPKADGTPRSRTYLNFTIGGYGVTVASDGRITVVPPGPAQGGFNPRP